MVVAQANTLTTKVYSTLLKVKFVKMVAIVGEKKKKKKKGWGVGVSVRSRHFAGPAFMTVNK